MDHVLKGMVIQLKEELVMISFDNQWLRCEFHIANDPCITIHYVTTITIHGVHIHDCKPGKYSMIWNLPEHYELWRVLDGDDVSIFNSQHARVDHSLSNCQDGINGLWPFGLQHFQVRPKD